MTETKRFVLVEDDSISTMMTTMTIERTVPGADVKAFDDSLEAMDYITNLNGGDNTVLLLDINMPKMNGWQFLDEFQNLPEAKRVAFSIYILTSSADTQDRARSAAYPFLKGYLLKPLNASDLQKALAG